MQGRIDSDAVLDLLRRTNKADALFKPLKKLKTALEKIGTEFVSTSPTSQVLLFHFGLGNDLDWQFIATTDPPTSLTRAVIIPGQSYCLLHFECSESAEEYLHRQKALATQFGFYQTVTHKQLTRTFIFLRCKANFGQKQQIYPVEDCDSYAQGLVSGLQLVEEFITREEEQLLLGRIERGEWHRLNNRRVQHYGFEFRYGENQVDKLHQHSPIPEQFTGLLDKLAQLLLLPYQFDQLTINDYFAGYGIPPHFDTHSPFEEHFVVVSLLAGIAMEFRRYDGLERQIYLHPHSLAVFSGEGTQQCIQLASHGLMGSVVEKLTGLTEIQDIVVGGSL